MQQGQSLSDLQSLRHQLRPHLCCCHSLKNGSAILTLGETVGVRAEGTGCHWGSGEARHESVFKMNETNLCYGSVEGSIGSAGQERDGCTSCSYHAVCVTADMDIDSDYHLHYAQILGAPA